MPEVGQREKLLPERFEDIEDDEEIAGGAAAQSGMPEAAKREILG